MHITKTTGILLITMLAVKSFSGNVTDEMLKAYSDVNYAKAYKLAEKQQSTPEGKLVKALCLLHDRDRQDISAAFELLAGLYNNQSLPKALWLQAALAYGRTAQLMQRRSDVYPQAAGIAFKDVFQTIQKKYPDSSEACEAIIYETEDGFDSNDKSKRVESFKTLKSFCQQFKGKTKWLVPLYLFLEFQSIRDRNYQAAVTYLLKAQELGIDSPHLKAKTLFRIGRLYDKELHNSAEALTFYTKFLKLYPESGFAPIVKRYIKKINQ